MRSIGLDVHGVIDADPTHFGEVMELLKLSGVRVHILTGPTLEDVEGELDRMNILPGMHYDDIFSIVDALKKTGVEMWKDDKGGWCCEDGVWWMSKGVYCRAHRIDVMVDNSARYADFMPPTTRFILYGLRGSLTHIPSGGDDK